MACLLQLCLSVVDAALQVMCLRDLLPQNPTLHFSRMHACAGTWQTC